MPGLQELAFHNKLNLNIDMVLKNCNSRLEIKTVNAIKYFCGFEIKERLNLI